MSLPYLRRKDIWKHILFHVCIAFTCIILKHILMDTLIFETLETSIEVLLVSLSQHKTNINSLFQVRYVNVPIEILVTY